MITLEEVKTAFGTIKICESETDHSRIFYQDNWSQSLADQNGHSLIAYIHAMYGILQQARAHKIAVLGCAGGTLSTMLADAGCNVTTIDINPHTFDLARRYFHLSPKVQCITGDAGHYLETTHETFDAIAIDVFDNGDIPPHLRTTCFFQLAATRLNPNGIILVNAIVDHDLDLLGDHVAATLHAATRFPVTLLDTPDAPDRNVIITAGILPPLTIPTGKEPLALQKELAKTAFRPARPQGQPFHGDTAKTV